MSRKKLISYKNVILGFIICACTALSASNGFGVQNSSSLSLGGQVRSSSSPVKRYNPLYLEGSVGVYGHELFDSAVLDFEFDARSESSTDNPHLWYLHQAEVQSNQYAGGKVSVAAGRFVFTDISQYSLVDGIKVTLKPSPKWHVIPVFGTLHSPEEALITNEEVPWGGLVLRYNGSGNTIINALQAKHPRNGLPIYFYNQRFTRHFDESPFHYVFYDLEASTEEQKLEHGEIGISHSFADDALVGQAGYRYVKSVSTIYERREELFNYLVRGLAKQTYLKCFLPKKQMGLQVLQSSVSGTGDVYYLSDFWWADFTQVGTHADVSLQMGTIMQSKENLKYAALTFAKKRQWLNWQLKYELDSLDKANNISGVVHAVELATKHKISDDLSAKLSILGESNLDARLDMSFLIILGYLDPI